MNEQANRSVPRAPLEIRVEYEHLNALVSDYTKNLSKGGAFVETSEPLAIGTKCYFTLTVPNMDEPLRLVAEVKHHDALEECQGMGISFDFSSQEEKDAFHTVLDKIMFDHLGEALFKRLKGAGQSV